MRWKPILIGIIVIVVSTVWFVATSDTTAHFWHFYFFPPREPWYRGAVWGNVIADFPNLLVIIPLGIAGYFFHQKIIAPMHEDIKAHALLAEKHHAEALRLQTEGKAERQAYAGLLRKHTNLLEQLADAIDPETEGGIHDLHEAIQKVDDKLDPATEGGLKVIVDKLDKVVAKGV